MGVLITGGLPPPPTPRDTWLRLATLTKYLFYSPFAGFQIQRAVFAPLRQIGVDLLLISCGLPIVSLRLLDGLYSI